MLNAVLYCYLAAAMIGVSASAVGLGFNNLGIPVLHPEMTNIYPNSLSWVLVVLLVGTVVATTAILGFKKLS